LRGTFSVCLCLYCAILDVHFYAHSYTDQ
jgi:hypothetical protein